jgi:hypothetical protein
MPNPSEIIIYSCFIGWAAYGILIVPYFGSQILQKTGESERFWFFILVILNLWALIFVLLRPKFRKGLDKSDLIKLSLFAVGYPAIFIPVILILNSI